MSAPLIPYFDLKAYNLAHASALRAAFEAVLQSGWYVRGDAVRNFEKAFADYVAQRTGTAPKMVSVGLGNGFDALYLTLLAQKRMAAWEDGDEVLVPAHSFIATAQAVVQAGLTPVFVDVCARDFLIDVTQIEACITARTRAIIPVHLYGKCCAMTELLSLAQRYRLFVLEDAAQAHGAIGVGQGDAVAFSFYPGKNLGALGDGGALVSVHADLVEYVRTLSNYGSRQKYVHTMQGLNSRLDELQAAFLSVKLLRLDADNAERQRQAQCYDHEIRNPQIILPYASAAQDQLSTMSLSESVYHIYPILCRERTALQKYLHAHGVETMIHYPTPLHQQHSLQTFVLPHQHFPCAEYVCAHVLSLPLNPMLTAAQQSHIIELLNRF